MIYGKDKPTLDEKCLVTPKSFRSDGTTFKEGHNRPNFEYTPIGESTGASKPMETIIKESCLLQAAQQRPLENIYGNHSSNSDAFYYPSNRCPSTTRRINMCDCYFPDTRNGIVNTWKHLPCKCENRGYPAYYFGEDITGTGRQKYKNFIKKILKF